MEHRAAEISLARADLCRFLAACYYQPGPELGEEKLFDSMLAVAVRGSPDLVTHVRALGEHYENTGIDELLVDYTRLFLGPTNVLAKPYGSVWLSGEQTLMQDSTVAVLELYREGGFDIDETFRELPDHIAAELEFLYLLIYRENEARQNTDSAALAGISSLLERFLAEHLGRWVGPFAAAVKGAAQTAFYRKLAELTECFVIAESRGGMTQR